MTNEPVVRRSPVRAALLVVLLTMLVVGSAAAQKLPKRPELPDDLDTNDARAYMQYGNRPNVSWKKAHDAYYWAWRLEPDQTHYLYAVWIAQFNRQSPQWRSEWRAGAGYVVKSKAAKAIDSVWAEVILRDPFPHFNQPCYLIPELDRQRDRLLAADIHYENGCYQKAIEAYAQALEKDPDLLGIHLFRARSLYFLHRPEAAAREIQIVLDSLRARDADRLVRWYESKAWFEYMIGVALTTANELGAARDAFGRALTEDLAFYMAHVGLSRVARMQGDVKTARDELALAVDLKPDDGVIRHEYGEVLLRAREAELAEAQFREAIRLEPYWAETYLLLGAALFEQGKFGPAAETLNQFLALCPTRQRRMIEQAQNLIAEAQKQLAASGAS